MAAPTVAEFRAQFPATFLAATHPDSLITSRIGEARLIHGVRKLATIYLVAHLLAVDGEATGEPDGGAGVVSVEGIGPRKVEYMNQSDGMPNRAFFGTTSYGRRFMALVASSPRGAIGARVV